MTLSGVDLNLLVALDALLTERNVTRAAERVSVGQPAMSASLARLRKQFDDPLLVRERRGYVLTTLAQSLVDPVRTALAAADAVLGVRPAFDPAVDEHTFRLVASEYVSVVLIRPLLAELPSEAPNVRIHVVALGPSLDEQLRRGMTDLLIFPSELAVTFKDLPRRELFTDRHVLVADADNADVTDEMGVDDFLRLPYLAVTGDLPSLVASQLATRGIVVQPQATTQSFAMVPLLVSRTRLVAFLQERLARAMAGSGRLRLLEPPIPLRPLTEAMVWDHRSTADPAHQWLRDRLVDQASRLD